MQDFGTARRCNSAQSGLTPLASKSHRLPRGSPRPHQKTGSHIPSIDRASLKENRPMRNASCPSPRLESLKSSLKYGIESLSRQGTHRGHSGVFGANPVTRSSANSSPCLRRESSPIAKGAGARCRSPTPEHLPRSALMPGTNGIRSSGRLRSPTASLIPPAMKMQEDTAASSLSSSVKDLSRTWSFPGPARSHRELSPVSGVSPRRMASATSPANDQLSRSWASWAFRSAPSTGRPPRARDLSASFEGAGRSSAVSSHDAARPATLAPSSISLPLYVPTTSPKQSRPLVKRARKPSDFADDASSELSGSHQPSRCSTPCLGRQTERAPSPPIPSHARMVSGPGLASSPKCSDLLVQVEVPGTNAHVEVAGTKGKECEKESIAKSMAGMNLLLAALGITHSGQADAAPAVVCAADRQQEARVEDVEMPSMVPLGEMFVRAKPRAQQPSEKVIDDNQCAAENQDPNLIINAQDMAKKVIPERAGALQKVNPPAIVDANVPCFKSESKAQVTARHVPDQWQATWIQMDSLRIRMEMLPGGLVIERDTNLSDLTALMADMQTLQSSETPPAQQVCRSYEQINAQIPRLVHLVEAVEAAYWNWCAEPDTPPLDMVAKQQVYDWLVPTGEKAVIMQNMKELGAKTCIGTKNVHSTMPAESQVCGRFLQYGLYKDMVKRCPACNKKWKSQVAVGESKSVQCVQDDIAVCPERGPAVNFHDGPASSFPVEARDLAWAVYAGCPDTYFRAYVLPSELEFAKESGNPVTVSWFDGDRRYRQVAAKDIIFMGEPLASEVRHTNSATWSAERGRLVSCNPALLP